MAILDIKLLIVPLCKAEECWYGVSSHILLLWLTNWLITFGVESWRSYYCRNSLHFMEPEGLLPCHSSMPIIISILNQMNCVHALPSFFKTHLSYPSTCLFIPSDLFRFLAKILYPFLLFHIVATCLTHLILDDLNTNYDPADYKAFTSLLLLPCC